MADDDIKPKLGRLRDSTRSQLPRLKQQVFHHAGKAGLRAQRAKGHIKPGALRRGMGTGVRAASGLIAPGSRRVIVKARYTRIAGNGLGAARAHLKYILRDGVTRDGAPGHLYDVSQDHIQDGNFLERSEHDPHQFRFIVSAEDSPRLADLKPVTRRSLQAAFSHATRNSRKAILSAVTSSAICKSVWNGDGVRRSRSVPFGTVG